jgi:hypothetical protein
MHKITLPMPDTSYNNKKGVFENDGPKDHRFFGIRLVFSLRANNLELLFGQRFKGNKIGGTIRHR